jgi:hypothetical protein
MLAVLVQVPTHPLCALQMVADPEVAKRLTYKMINRSMPAQLRLDAQTDVINTAGLAAARCAGLLQAVHWQTADIV